MKKNAFAALLLAVLMLCSLVGCATASKPNTDSTTTTASATTTTATSASTTTTTTSTTTTTATNTTTTASSVKFDAPLTLTVEEGVHSGIRAYKDTSVETPNYTLRLTANTDLVQVRLISINPDTSLPDAALHTLPALKKGESQYILTYINDVSPNRGVACTDKQGKTWYYAFVYSGRDGAVYLESVNPAH